jgi:hypothetical protein
VSPWLFGWQKLLEQKDAHQYDDFALTKCYSVLEDIGLGSNWEQAERELVAAGKTERKLPWKYPSGRQEIDSILANMGLFPI